MTCVIYHILCGKNDFEHVFGHMLSALPVAVQPMDSENSHWVGRTVAVHMKVGGYP